MVLILVLVLVLKLVFSWLILRSVLNGENMNDQLFNVHVCIQINSNRQCPVGTLMISPNKSLESLCNNLFKIEFFIIFSLSFFSFSFILEHEQGNQISKGSCD